MMMMQQQRLLVLPSQLWEEPALKGREHRQACELSNENAPGSLMQGWSLGRAKTDGGRRPICYV